MPDATAVRQAVAAAGDAGKKAPFQTPADFGASAERGTQGLFRNEASSMT